MNAPAGRHLRLGVFGVGRMGRVHVENLVRLHQARCITFAALGDRLPQAVEQARAVVSSLGGPELASELQHFGDPETMALAGLQGVVIASRTEHHARDAMAFARRGTPTLVEKPLAGSIAEAAAMVAELGEARHRLVHVAFQRHYDAANRLAGEWVAGGLVGRLQQTSHVLQDKNPTPEGYQSCGITADMAIHLVFEAMSFRGFALPRRVQALRFFSPPYEDRAGEGANIVHVFCQWDDGSLAHLWGSRINATGYDNQFTLIGTDGRIDIGAFAGDFGPISVRLWQGVGRGPLPRGTLVEAREFPMTRPRPADPDFYARYGAAYEAELCDFVTRIGDGVPFEPDVDIGWKTLLVANVAEESSRRGGVAFDLRRPDGGELASAADAAIFAASIGVA
jgi:myo-inositol 2-dehydrogenase/D-chiro-inositol 1-dehydrogenase